VICDVYCGDAMPSCAKPVNPGTEIVPVFRNASCVVTSVNRIGISGIVSPTGSGGGFDGSYVCGIRPSRSAVILTTIRCGLISVVVVPDPALL